jgi:phosphatidylethanolamine-binding protein (PEBP) family uncharacterized protein
MKFKIRKTFRRKHRNRRKTRRLRGGNRLEVFYDNQQLVGQELPKPLTQMKPSVKFPTTGKLYTLVMWDPDVPEQSQPSFVHWIATNLEGPNDIMDNQLLEYVGPNPPKGKAHRYFFSLFEQQGHIRPQQPERPNFSIDEFVNENNLKEVSRVYMLVSANA